MRGTRELEVEAEHLLRRVAADRPPVDAGAVAKMLGLIRQAHEAGRQSVRDDQARMAEQIRAGLDAQPPRDDRAFVFLDLREVRRLLAGYRGRDSWYCPEGTGRLWMDEAAALLERIAGES